MTKEELKEILIKVYDKQTAHQDWKEGWNKSNPTFGQCAPTALLVQYYFGGEIYYLSEVKHYFNILDGDIIDLTSDQFKRELDYSNRKKKQPNLEKAQTKERFELLKERVERVLMGAKK